MLRTLVRLAIWLPVFYVLWIASALVWMAMLIQGFFANDRIPIPDCFLRSIARAQHARATIRPWAVRAIIRLVRTASAAMPAVVSPMDAWRILGVCTVMWALQRRVLLVPFHVAVLLSPALTFVHALAAGWTLGRRHPWYRRPSNLMIVWWHELRYGVTPAEFAELELHEEARRRIVDRHATTLMWLFDVSTPIVLGRAVDHLSDKRRFHTLCEGLGVPAPALVAVFGGGARIDAAPGALPRRDLFSKENHSSQGSRGALWTYVNAGWSGDGRTWSESALLEELAARTSTGAPSVGAPSDRVEILLQERIVAHPALRGASSALPTCRIVTMRPSGGMSRVVQAMFRMASAPDAAVDNFHAGGVACGIDLASGRLRANGLSGTDVLRRVDMSPLDGRRLDEITVPYWAQALALCRRLHDELGWPPEIGWDVAITAGGPVLIEANHTSVAVPVQAVNGAPYGVELYEECLASWLAAGD